MQLIKRLALFFVFISLLSSLKARDTLKLREAIGIALKNNHDIRISGNNTKIQKNEAHPGQANLLPNVSLSSSYSYQNQDTRQEFAGNLGSNEIDGAQTTTLNSSVDVRYTVFDGMGRIYHYKQLKTEHKSQQEQEQITVENTILQVASTYYQVARLQKQKEIARRTMKLSRQRLHRAREEKQYGKGSRLNVSNARVDLDTDSTTFVDTRTQLTNARHELNLLLGRNIRTAFAVEDTVQFSQAEKSHSAFQEKAMEQNTSIQKARYDMRVATLQKKRAAAEHYPELSINGGYSYSNQQSDAGIMLENETNGLNAGISLSYNIYSGGKRTIQEKNAAIRRENSRVQWEKTRMQVRKNLANAYEIYQDRLLKIKMEKRSVKNARLNYERSKKAFSMGQIDNTELRNAQVNLIRAQSRLSNARYDAKISELELLQFTGQLMEKKQVADKK